MENSKAVVVEGDTYAEDVKVKLAETNVPGFIVTCSSEECEVAGAFVEDALSAAEALDSVDEEVV